MDFLQNFDLNSALGIVLLCGGLCVVGVVLMIALQFISGTLGFLLGFFELFIEILAAGPIAWCGCLLMLFACAICGLMIYSLVTVCGTPDQVMICRFFGY
ncbi:MAG: hypothetical protein D6712_17615 [Chloroflexi bacterium]|nr:MAG: hypothetical protein D6712_17615 [Chloroflexota bacterium]